MGQAVATSEVQSLVFSAHGPLPHSLAARLIVRDRAAAAAGLRAAADAVSFGIPDPSRTSALQVLLSASGLRALGAPDDQVKALGRPFQQGMAVPHRSRALGDGGKNAPDGWEWSDAAAHAVLLVYGVEAAAVTDQCHSLLARLGAGWECSACLATRLPADGREHFGFRDGLAGVQIDLQDGRTPRTGTELIPAGELLLGHRNALGIVQPVPPIGRDSAYVAVRQLAQDVKGFWDFWKGQGDEQTGVWLAAKAAGRWPNGMPVSGSDPQPEPAYVEAEAMRPLSFRDDPHGDRCPLGAHVRRANPRDGLVGDPAKSVELTALHQILRRGRIYGPLAPDDWFPASLRRGGPAESLDAERGLLFVALCADLSRQFEFIQQTWLNNPKHSGHHDEVDPLAAGHGIDCDGQRFSIPRAPVRLRLADVQRWVTMRGGGYFLLPGRRALEEIASGSVSGPAANATLRSGTISRG